MGLLFKSPQAKEKEVQEEVKILLKDILLDTEEIKGTWYTGIDFCVITNKRFIYIDKKGIKKESIITSILFSKINYVSVKQVNSNLLLKCLTISITGKEFEFDFSDSEYTKQIQRELLERL